MMLTPGSSGWGNGCRAGLVQRGDVLRQGCDGRAVDDYSRRQPDPKVGLRTIRLSMPQHVMKACKVMVCHGARSTAGKGHLHAHISMLSGMQEVRCSTARKQA